MAGARFGACYRRAQRVAGPNDHSTLGYFLRLTILGLMAPVAFGGNAVYVLVDVDAFCRGPLPR